MYKGLVTSGCSFSLWHSVDGKGWPYYLQQQLLSFVAPIKILN